MRRRAGVLRSNARSRKGLATLHIAVADRETRSRAMCEAVLSTPALAFRQKSRSLWHQPTRGLYRQVPFPRPNDTFLEHSPFRRLTRGL